MLKPKREMMEYSDMVSMQEKKSGSQIYKVQSDEHKKVELSTLTTGAADRIKTYANRGKIGLTESTVEEVAAHINIYFQACADTGTIPSFECLAHALGYSKSGLYKYISEHPHSSITELLEMTREEFSAIIENAAMMGNLAPAPAIFALKSVYGRRETYEIVNATPEGPLGRARSPEEAAAYARELKERYLSESTDDYDPEALYAKQLTEGLPED